MAEDYGPRGDADRHLPMDELRYRLGALPEPPRDRGRVALLVVRRADGIRDTPTRVTLTPEAGMPGDRWARRIPDRPEMQLAVMRRDIAELVANGQPIEMAGDNLFVDLDLSDDNLPTGSRLRVGQATVEVSPEPHNGCLKFRDRFGPDALKLTAAPELRSTHLRGIYWTVVEAGEVAVGDAIEVIHRPS
jgi:MOSC domain-containing protein YiiM